MALNITKKWLGVPTIITSFRENIFSADERKSQISNIAVMNHYLKGNKIRSYWRKDTLREVYLDNEFVHKHYHVKPGTWRFPKPWIREDAALKALPDQGFPKSYGYKTELKDNGLDVVFTRDYIDGKHIKSLTHKDVIGITDELTAIHKNGVITDDAKIENFIKGKGNQIQFIDFGSAIVFKRKSPLYYMFIGREMVKFLRLTLRWDMPLWDVFIKRYKEVHPLSIIQFFFVKFGFFLTLNLRRLRKRSLYP
jgi:serine/threonine protein kinase